MQGRCSTLPLPQLLRQDSEWCNLLTLRFAFAVGTCCCYLLLAAVAACTDAAMDGDDRGEAPTAVALHDHLDHMAHHLDQQGEEDGQTEAGDDGMEYNVMDEDEEAEQDAARRLQEELNQKRLVGGAGGVGWWW